MWIDSHAHLFDLSEDQLCHVISKASNVGVTCILNASTTFDSVDTVIKQCLLHKNLYACVGISPFDVIDLPDNWIKRIESVAKTEKVVAIGEIGLDDSNPSYPDIDDQLPIFEEQLSLALKLSLPAIMHSRGMEERVLSFCSNMGIKKAVFHCFTGSVDTAKKIIDAGYFISLSGIVTFKNSGLDDLLRFIPLDKLLIETDAPYLAPSPHRGKVNDPSFIPLIAETIAKSRGITTETLAKAIVRNCKELFFMV